MSDRARTFRGVVGVVANAAGVAWFGAAAYDSCTRMPALVEALRAHRFVPPAAAEAIAPLAAMVHLAVATTALLGLCTRSLRPLGPLAMLGALTVFTAYLVGVWAFGDPASACGCAGSHEATVPWAVARNAAAWAATLLAFWATLPRKCCRG